MEIKDMVIIEKSNLVEVSQGFLKMINQYLDRGLGKLKLKEQYGVSQSDIKRLRRWSIGDFRN